MAEKKGDFALLWIINTVAIVTFSIIATFGAYQVLNKGKYKGMNGYLILEELQNCNNQERAYKYQNEQKSILASVQLNDNGGQAILGLIFVYVGLILHFITAYAACTENKDKLKVLKVIQLVKLGFLSPSVIFSHISGLLGYFQCIESNLSDNMMDNISTVINLEFLFFTPLIYFLLAIGLAYLIDQCKKNQNQGCFKDCCQEYFQDFQKYVWEQFKMTFYISLIVVFIYWIIQFFGTWIDICLSIFGAIFFGLTVAEVNSDLMKIQ